MKRSNFFIYAAPFCLLCLINATTFAQINDLIGIWHLNGNTTDSSGYGHNGTIVGTVTQTIGRFGYGYHFDGNSYIDCGNVNLNSTGEFSVSAWVKSTEPYVTEVWRMVVSKLDGTTGGPLELHLGDGRNITGVQGTATNYLAWNGGTGLYYTFSSYDLNRNAKDGNWHHLAVTFKSGSQIVYFDGVQVGYTTSTAPLPNTSSNFRIGGTFFGPYHKPLIGDIDEVSAYNRALSSTEIQILFQGGCTECLTPTGLSTTNITSTTATANWTTNPCAVKYKLQGRLKGTITWRTFTLPAGATSYSVTSLTPDTTYEWRIASVCQLNPLIVSPYSSIQSFTTINLSICSGLPESLTQNLVAYYPFCGDANDISGNNNNPNFNNATLTTDRFGNVNSAYSFYGSQYIKGSCSKYPANSRTISVWFKINDSTKHNVLIAYGGGICGTSFFADLNHGSHPHTYTSSGHCEVNNCFTNSNYPPPQGWNNWIITSGNNVTKFYLNGVLIHTCSNVDFDATDIAGKDFAFGTCISPQGYAPYSDAALDYLRGSLDDIVIYDTVFDSIQVQQLYQFFNTGSAPPKYIPEQLKNKCSLNAAIFPNPVHTTLNVKWDNNSSKTTIKVFDATGRVIITQQATLNSAQLAVQKLAAGTYFLRLENANGTVLYNSEFVKE